MAIYDDNWKNYCFYTTSYCETKCQYDIIEYAYRMGVGIMQWTHSRSYGLLKRFYDADSSSFYAEPMKTQLASGNSWGENRSFWNDEYNNVIKVLQRSDSKDIQGALFDEDLTKDIENVLKPRKFTEPRVAIIAELIYWVSGSTTVLNRIVNRCQGGFNTTLSQIIYSCRIDSLLGGYQQRWDDAEHCLNNWNGDSEPPAYGQFSGIPSDKSDENPEPPDEDIHSAIPNPENPTEIKVSKKSVPKIMIEKMMKVGNEYHIVGRDNQGKRITIRMYGEGQKDVVWTPSYRKVNANGNTNNVPVNPQPVPTPENPNPPKPEKPVQPPSTGGTKADDFVEYMRTWLGKLSYEMLGNDSNRFSFDDKYADCSSFVITCFLNFTGKKLYDVNGTLCETTATLAQAGKKVASGDNNYRGVLAQKDKIKNGDLIVMAQTRGEGGGSAHVVTAIDFPDNPSVIHCTSDPKHGEPIINDFDTYFDRVHASRNYWDIRRIW